MRPVDRRRGEAAAADRMRGWRLARVALLPKSVKRTPVLTLDRRPVGNLVLGEAENQGLRPHPMESPRSVGGRGMFEHACRVATAIQHREAHRSEASREGKESVGTGKP